MSKLKSLIPPIIIALTVLVIGLANYVPGTILTGGDNLHPEFNLLLNIKRSLFAVWQEYQGPGLLGGMGHASDLLRQLFLLPISLILPTNDIRYFYTILTLFAGSLGAYFFIQYLLPSVNLHITSNQKKAFSLLGALFYVCNLATVQTYYTAFEVFTAHFAALPWVLLTGTKYFMNPSKRNFLLFSLVLLLSTPGAYVPTLFVVEMIALFMIAPFALYKNKKDFNISYLIKRIAKTIGIITIINAFWLLPFIYFTVLKSSVNIHAKINQMATENIFLQNKEFGHISDTILLKGFWFHNVGIDKNQQLSYIMQPWINHMQNNFIPILGMLLFAITLFGLLFSIKKKEKILLGYAILFIFSFTMLTTATAPFSWINEVARYLPIVNQAFRFPFTKFSILTSFTYAIFFSIGVSVLFTTIKKYIHSNLAYTIIPLSIGIIITFAFPIFQGHLFYERERLKMPVEYQQVYSFFNRQDPHTRIANFPQHTFWSWYFYNWGYSGSGFLWYGIEQPILDRAFDVWSTESENYYYEVSYALYSKNKDLFENVLNKYQISWVVIDQHVISPSTPQALFYKDLGTMLDSIPSIKKAQQFGKIAIYQVKLKDDPKNFIFETSDNLSTVNPYPWINNDQAYTQFGNYVTESENPSFYYPFRSFHSNKSQEDIPFQIQEHENDLVLQTTIPPYKEERKIHIPLFQNIENIIPAEVITQQDNQNNTVVSLILKTPTVTINNEKIYGNEIMYPIFTVPAQYNFPFILNINGTKDILITDTRTKLPTSYLMLHQLNSLVLSNNNRSYLEERKITTEELLQPVIKSEPVSKVIQPSTEPVTVKISIPKITNNFLSFKADMTKKPTIGNCNIFRKGDFHAYISPNGLTLSSKNTTTCTSYLLPQILHNYSYVLFAKSQNITGKSLHMWVLNEDTRFTPIDTYLPKTKETLNSSFIIPPYEKFGRSYSIHLENVSIGDDDSTNVISNLSFYPFFYNFSKLLIVTPSDVQFPPKKPANNTLEVSHPNESLYIIHQQNQRSYPSTVVLSQSYDKGWKAYQFKKDKLNILNLIFPFFFSEELQHKQINGWENGWRLLPSDTSTAVVIIYLPQYLEYLGFLILIGFASFLIMSQVRIPQLKLPKRKSYHPIEKEPDEEHILLQRD